MENPEKFYAKIIKVGNSLMISVDGRLAKFAGFKKGDEVIVWIKKHAKKQ